jgi:ribonucleoside-diphosphate reductase alpha chain
MNIIDHDAPQGITQEVLLEKYCKDGETTAEQIYKRVARAVAQAEASELRALWAERFEANMRRGAIGAGRIMSAAGTGIQATLINCFVQPIGDCMDGFDEDGKPGIYRALTLAAETMRRGGGVGYNFSAIRPRGARVRSTHSAASGPCSYMDVFDASCKTVESAGARRGAQMGILGCDHPDIFEFIDAKRTKGRWNNFNISVGISDAFMRAVEADATWQLVHKAEPSAEQIKAGAFQREDGMWVYRTGQARELQDRIMRSTYDFAEPGVVFLDTMNRDNNLHAIETIEATNPCSEQPLPQYGCCDLGPIILTRYVQRPFSNRATFLWAEFKHSVQTHVRFLDDVLDVTFWPLEEQRNEAMSKRRIGVGFTGLGDALIMLGIRYDSTEGRHLAAKLATEMRDAAYSASIELAEEKGAFPRFDPETFLEEGTFASRLPQELKDRIRTRGIRNSHLLSIAPTGTVSLAFADNASNGIEPAFSWGYNRKKRLADGSEKKFPVLDHALRVFLRTLGPTLAAALLDAVVSLRSEFEFGGVTHKVKDVLPTSFVSALDMSAADHMAMLAAVQPFIDTAISKTVNIPADYSFDEFKDLYVNAWHAGLKGLATYRPNDTLGAVLSVEAAPVPAPSEHVASTAPQEVDPLTQVLAKRIDGDLEAVTTRIRYQPTGSGDKSLYVSVSFTEVEGVIDGQRVKVSRPIEVFIPGGQSDVPHEWISTFARSLSLNARSGLLPKALKDAREVKSDRGVVRFGFHEKPDGSKVPRYHESEVGVIAYAIQQLLIKRGFLDAEGNPVPARVLASAKVRSQPAVAPAATAPAAFTERQAVMPGRTCTECGAHAVIKKDGCEFCTHCGHTGACG